MKKNELVSLKKEVKEKTCGIIEKGIGEVKAIENIAVDNPTTIKKPNRIGFTTDSRPIIKSNKEFIKIDGVTENDIIRYIRKGFELQKKAKDLEGKEITTYGGLDNINKNCDLGYKVCRIINGVLSEKGITKIIDTNLGKRTVINFSEEELIGDEKQWKK